MTQREYGFSSDAVLKKRYFYQMDFELEFPYSNDTVYIAYSRPYPYSKVLASMFSLEEKLQKLPREHRAGGQVLSKDKRDFTIKINRRGIIYERRKLCRTICGLPVPHIQVTSSNNVVTDFRRRKTIFVTARVHPGETNASTVYDGFMNELCSSESVDKSSLLGHYIFRTIPCLNPDGVVCGNYRSSLAGVDLNRQWILPDK